MTGLAVALACMAPAVAFAQGAGGGNAASGSADCPPGSWFCADSNEKPAAPAGQPVTPPASQKAPDAADGQLQPLPSESAPKSAQKPPVTYAPSPAPPVVVYQPSPPVVVHEAPPPYAYTPRNGTMRRREWGLNLRLEGAMLGSHASSASGMAGVGMGLRYKPVPSFGLEASFDFLGGRDYKGLQRSETGFTIDGIVFVNPRSKAQLYFLAGFGWSGATVRDDRYYEQARYGYFGGIAGVGLELRLAKHFALNADIRGFVRTRTDSAAEYQPEFYDASTGRSTNTSGGGLFTGGMTFYF